MVQYDYWSEFHPYRRAAARRVEAVAAARLLMGHHRMFASLLVATVSAHQVHALSALSATATEAEESTGGHTTGRAVLLLDGQWRLTNDGIGPMSSRKYAVLHNHSLVDPPRGSWSQYPAPQPSQQTVLQVTLPAKFGGAAHTSHAAGTAEECCDACAQTAGCGAAVWDGSNCEARAANSVPLKSQAPLGPAACVLSGGAVDLLATVPGDVNDELMKAKLLPDLLAATNSMEARWVPQYEWRYERNFTLPSGWTLTTASSVRLHFGGVDYNCSISLNGQVRHPWTSIPSPLVSSYKPNAISCHRCL